MSEDQNRNVLSATRAGEPATLAVSTTPGPTPRPVEAPIVPRHGIPLPVVFRPATYSFAIESMQILDTRSRHEDSDKASASVAVGTGAATTAVKDLGDVNNGTHPINLQVGPVDVRDPNIGIAFNYVIVNAGHSDWATIDSDLTKLGNTLATQGAQAATKAIGAAVGAEIGGTVLVAARPGARVASRRAGRDHHGRLRRASRRRTTRVQRDRPLDEDPSPRRIVQSHNLPSWDRLEHRLRSELTLLRHLESDPGVDRAADQPPVSAR